MASDRLKYEFAYIGDDSGVGFTSSFAGLPVVETSTFGSKWHLVTDFIDQPDKVTLEFGLNDDTDEIKLQLSSIGLERSVSSSISAFAALYQYVYGWLIEHENAAINSIAIRITDVGCGKYLGIWQINTENLKWCDDGECKLSFNLQEYRPEFGCLQDTLISDNHRGWFPPGGFIDGEDGITGLPLGDYIHPRYQYCDEIHPQFLQNFLFVLAQSIGLALGTILGVIGEIADFVGLDGLADSIDDFLSSIFNSILGCGRYHPAPFVRYYFINACSKCGITFESDILNDPDSPWYNTTHLFAPVDKGLAHDSHKDWIDENRPIYTVPTYAFSLKNVFNAKYFHRDGVFYFMRKDTFPETTVFDFTGDDANYIVGAVCYNSNSKDKRPQSVLFYWGQDSLDQAGNQALPRYSGAKDWTANNKRYTGKVEIRIEDYSVARYTNDGIEQKLIFSGEGLGAPVEDYWPADQLLMEQDTTSLGKLIVWDPDTGLEDARAVRALANTNYSLHWEGEWIYGATPDADYYVYNYPMFFDWRTNEGYNESGPYPDALIHTNIFDLHKIDDPTKNTLLNKDWNVTLELCCEIVNRLISDDSAGDGIYAHLDYLIQVNANEKGTIERVELDYDKYEVRISGKIKYPA